MSRLNGTKRKVLQRGVKEPRALQLFPSKGYLFYTDWGQGAHIGRMGMDGSDHRHIINESIGMTIVFPPATQDGLVYWTANFGVNVPS